eukprot:TRINITY_DN1553_c2_g3_i1.p1 TRINITY_DN1553_c2_g3~~TRINITY_DN1553_c2_g3_i1.p1  ORF type:complete len:651 (+),score=172.04 TRINITY_DN1553_c2_g3_i1:78-2030(+)
MQMRAALSVLALASAGAAAGVSCDPNFNNATRLLRTRILGCGADQDQTCADHNKYDPEHAPVYNGRLVDVRLSLLVSQVREFNARHGYFRLGLFLQELWEDPRLTWDPADFCGAETVHVDAKDVWMPDTYSPSSQDVENFPNEEFTRVAFNGSVLHSRRILNEFGCSNDWDFSWYPFDTQVCEIPFLSYSYASEVRYVLPRSTDPTTDAIRCLPRCPQEAGVFQLKEPSARTSISALDGRSNLVVRFAFERDTARYFVHFFLPQWLIVGMSFIGTYISVESAPARVSVATISVLAFVTLSFGPLRVELPAVRYSTAFDYYLLLCLLATLANTCEYALVNFMLATAKATNDKVAKRRALRRQGTDRKLPSWDRVSDGWRRRVSGIFSGIADDELVKHLTSVLHSITGGHDSLLPVVTADDLIRYRIPPVLARAVVGLLEASVDLQSTLRQGRKDAEKRNGSEPFDDPEDQADGPQLSLQCINMSNGTWKRAVAVSGSPTGSPRETPSLAEGSLRRMLFDAHLREHFTLFADKQSGYDFVKSFCCEVGTDMDTKDLRGLLAGLEGIDPQEVNSLCGIADVDGDGRVDLQEFKDLCSESLGSLHVGEPEAFVFCGRGFTKETALRFEDRYRVFAPSAFIILTLIWFAVVVSCS